MRRLWRAKIWHNRRLDAFVRGADGFAGGDFARFVAFVRAEVPAQATVVLPAEPGPFFFNSRGVMQFYLFPRRLEVCDQARPSQGCLRWMHAPEAYIIALTASPPNGGFTAGRKAVPFSDQVVLYRPASEPSMAPAAREAGLPLLSLGLDLALVTALLGLGVVLVEAFVGRGADLLLRAGLGYGLGAAALTWALFLLGWAGLPFRLPVVAGAYLLLLAGAWWVRRRGQSADQLPERTQSAEVGAGWGRRARLVLWAGLGVLVGAAVVISVGMAYHSWDAVALWAVKGYGIAREGSLFAGAAWGNKALFYPLNLPLQIGLFRLVSEDVVPGSKLIFPLYFASLLLVSHRYLRRTGSPEWVALLGLLGLGTAPLIFQHATIGYANLPFTFYLLAAVYLGAEALEARNSRMAALAGTLLAMAAWTRPEGLLLAAGAVLPLVALAALLRGFDGRRYVCLVVPLAAYAMLWALFQAGWGSRQVTEVSVVSTALPRLLTEPLNKSAGYVMLVYFLDQVRSAREWGVLLPLLPLGVLAALASRRLSVKDLSVIGPLVSSGVVVGLVFWMYFLIAYAPGEDLFYWLNTGFARQLMPGMVGLGVVGLAAMGRLAAGKVGGDP